MAVISEYVGVTAPVAGSKTASYRAVTGVQRPLDVSLIVVDKASIIPYSQSKDIHSLQGGES
jgi:hypothetical protein